jgi:ubiquinone/menaquinone biosynthesis C-methylase UbiE
MRVMAPDDTYTHGHHESVLRSHSRRTVENSAGYLLPRLAAGSTVLDIGCGPGTITYGLAERVAPGRVVGIDREPGPLTDAQATAEEKGLTNLRFTVGDAYALDFPDGSFDVVHAHQVLQHLTDPVAALVEMRRVCRPGGVVAVRDADYAAMTWHPADPRLDRWLDVYHRVARHNHAEPDAGRMLKSWALAAGFTDLTCTAAAWCFAGAEERAWWAGTWAQRITESAIARQAVAAGISTADELAEVAAGWRAWADAPDAWFAVLNAEVLAVCP